MNPFEVQNLLFWIWFDGRVEPNGQKSESAV